MTETPDPSDAPEATPDASPASAGPAAHPLLPPWSSLDPSARMVAGAGLALVGLTLLGAILGAWSSIAFTLLLMVTGLIGAGLAWFGEMPELREQPIPLPAIESVAALIAAVLGVFGIIELVFQFDQLDGVGDIFGAVIVVAVAIASVAFLLGTARRDPGFRAAATAADRATRLAVGGFALVLIGWALNVSVGYWNLAPGVVTLGLVALALGLVLVAPRIHPWVAWLAAGSAGLALVQGLGLWGSLMEQGNQTEFGFIDIGAMLLTFVGIVLLGLGAVLAALPAKAETGGAGPASTPPAEPGPPAGDDAT